MQNIAEHIDTRTIPCRNCGFCQIACPMGVQIPKIFTLMNAYAHLESRVYAKKEYGKRFATGRASDCIQCGLCESRCPQELPIPDLLEQVVSAFE